MSSNRARADGFTLVEMVAVIVLIGLLSAAAVHFFQLLVPGYVLAAETEQVLAPLESAVWQLRRDYAQNTTASAGSVSGSGATCRLTLNVASNGATVNYSYYVSGGNLYRKQLPGGPTYPLLAGIQASTCAFTVQPGTPNKLTVSFTVAGQTNGVSHPVNLTLSSYEH